MKSPAPTIRIYRCAERYHFFVVCDGKAIDSFHDLPLGYLTKIEAEWAAREYLATFKQVQALDAKAARHSGKEIHIRNNFRRTP